MPKLAKTYTKVIDRKVYKMQWWVENLDFIDGHWQVTKIFLGLKGPGTKIGTFICVKNLQTNQVLERDHPQAQKLTRLGKYGVDWAWEYIQRPVSVNNALLWHHFFDDMEQAEAIMLQWQAGEIDHLIMESLL